MITFLPYGDFKRSAKVLDWRRLGKQRSESKMMLNILENDSSKLKLHPAVLMWRGYEDALRLYMNEMIKEWQKRGYKNSMELEDVGSSPKLPFWLNKDVFHMNHILKLCLKDREYYKDHFPVEVTLLEKMGIKGLEYIWPVVSRDREEYIKVGENYYVHRELL